MTPRYTYALHEHRAVKMHDLHDWTAAAVHFLFTRPSNLDDVFWSDRQHSGLISFDVQQFGRDRCKYYNQRKLSSGRKLLLFYRDFICREIVLFAGRCNIGFKYEDETKSKWRRCNEDALWKPNPFPTCNSKCWHLLLLRFISTLCRYLAAAYTRHGRPFVGIFSHLFSHSGQLSLAIPPCVCTMRKKVSK